METIRRQREGACLQPDIVSESAFERESNSRKHCQWHSHKAINSRLHFWAVGSRLDRCLGWIGVADGLQRMQRMVVKGLRLAAACLAIRFVGLIWRWRIEDSRFDVE